MNDEQGKRIYLPAAQTDRCKQYTHLSTISQEKCHPENNFIKGAIVLYSTCHTPDLVNLSFNNTVYWSNKTKHK